MSKRRSDSGNDGKKKKQGNQRKFWCFTINDCKENDCPIWRDEGTEGRSVWDVLVALGNSVGDGNPPGVVRYLCFQGEEGKEDHRKHIQGTNSCAFFSHSRVGYISLNTRKRLDQVKGVLGGFRSTHLEPRKGTEEEAREYCRKADTRVRGRETQEFGRVEEVKRGERTDLKEWVETVRSGLTDHELLDSNPNCAVRYQRSIGFIRAAKHQRESIANRTVAVWVYWGPPGVGKSYGARMQCQQRGGGYYRVSESNMSSDRKTVWMSGYNGQKSIIIDDLNTGWIPYNILLNLCEGYPMELQTKVKKTSTRIRASLRYGCLLMLLLQGGSTWACWDTVYITSNINPADWYGVGSALGYPEENRRALERRIAGGGVRGGIVHWDTNPEVSDEVVYEPRSFRMSDIVSGRVSPPHDDRGGDGKVGGIREGGEGSQREGEGEEEDHGMANESNDRKGDGRKTVIYLDGTRDDN